MNTAICYMTGTHNEKEIRRRFDLLPNKYEKFILKDKKCDYFSDENIFEFDFEYFNTGTNIWTNTYLAILQFYEKNRDFDYYWLLEDDLIFNGDWNIFFNFYGINNSDLIITEHHINCPKHWNGGWYSMERNTFKGGFVPNQIGGGMVAIQRFSNNLLKKMHELTLTGIHAHAEVFSVSIANHFGMKIEDISDIFYKIEYCNTSHHFKQEEIDKMPPNHIIHSSKIL